MMRSELARHAERHEAAVAVPGEVDVGQVDVGRLDGLVYEPDEVAHVVHAGAFEVAAGGHRVPELASLAVLRSFGEEQEVLQGLYLVGVAEEQVLERGVGAEAVEEDDQQGLGLSHVTGPRSAAGRPAASPRASGKGRGRREGVVVAGDRVIVAGDGVIVVGRSSSSTAAGSRRGRSRRASRRQREHHRFFSQKASSGQPWGQGAVGSGFFRGGEMLATISAVCCICPVPPVLRAGSQRFMYPASRAIHFEGLTPMPAKSRFSSRPASREPKRFSCQNASFQTGT